MTCTPYTANARSSTLQGPLPPSCCIRKPLTASCVRRKESVSQLTYYVVDSVEALSKFGTDAWDRVVCVMTTGQAWQFKTYRWSEPKTLFHHGPFAAPCVPLLRMADGNRFQ